MRSLPGTPICWCDPTRGQSCTACDGTLAEHLDAFDGADLIEPCVAVDGDELCNHPAEPGTAFCVDHQVLGLDRIPA